MTFPESTVTPRCATVTERNDMKLRISLWMFGLCLIRSQPIYGEEADQRMESWRNVFGQKADIRVER